MTAHLPARYRTRTLIHFHGLASQFPLRLPGRGGLALAEEPGCPYTREYARFES